MTEKDLRILAIYEEIQRLTPPTCPALDDPVWEAIDRLMDEKASIIRG
jgi:hypothetical protein